MLYCATNLLDIKEFDAPESNKTIAGLELTGTYQAPHPKCSELPQQQHD
jgi:hypothetical protein